MRSSAVRFALALALLVEPRDSRESGRRCGPEDPVGTSGSFLANL